MNRPKDLDHLTTDDFILFMDRELDVAATAAAERHLLACVDCSQRLEALRKGSGAYRGYEEQVLKPALAVPETGWRPLGDRLRKEPRRAGRIWWAAGGIAATVALLWAFFPKHDEPSVQDVLEQAEQRPELSGGEIVLTTNEVRLARPAVLETGTSEVRFQHVAALFVKANYSWSQPLSARSFARWRSKLPEKRDFVTIIRDESGRRFYRVRTRTEAGSLRSAALLLQQVTYRATKASFEFQGEDLIEISEQSQVSPQKPSDTATPPIDEPGKATETVAGPEDELRVFAALDAIGADLEEPVEVRLEPGHHHVLVTGMGMPAQRRKQIETALATLPNTVVRFRASQPMADTGGGSVFSDGGSDTGHSAFLRRLQDMAGGARALQTITDESLETSNSLFAQSHWLFVLAQEFPLAVESGLTANSARTLLTLRQRRLGAMTYAVRRLKDQLRPFLKEDRAVTETAQAFSWQSQSQTIYESIGSLDRLVIRLLAGSYDEQTGERMLKELPEDISRTERLLLTDSR